MITRYWVVRFGCTYNIVIHEGYEYEGNADVGAQIIGPFRTLDRAKRQMKKWIKIERAKLAVQLKKINSLKVDEVKNAEILE